MIRIHRPVRSHNPSQRRSGLTTPAVAIALLVIMMGLSLILDRLWLESARLELKTAAESAALAAAGELACDDLLRTDPDYSQILTNARDLGGYVASLNVVCGAPVTLNTQPQGDIQFDAGVDGSSNEKENEEDQEPDTVATTATVTAQRVRSNNNPVALFIAGVSGVPYGDVVVHAAATIRNDVAGLQPYQGHGIPALPIGIWQSDPQKKRQDTWNDAIENRLGNDAFSYDQENQVVTSGGDGIPELVLHSLRVGGKTTDPNVQLLDIGTGRIDLELSRQFESGISVEDLEQFKGALYIGQGAIVDIESTPEFTGVVNSEFQKIVGDCRICFLYSTATPQSEANMQNSHCTQIVAVRIMAVDVNTDGSCDVTIQPTVMTSKTVILVSETLGSLPNSGSDPNVNGAADTDANSSNSALNATPNRYLYKLQLTR